MEETQRRKGACLRYGSALAAAILATLLRMWLDPLLGDQAPFTTYFAAIMFVAWYAGLGPSLMAIAFSVLLGSYFFAMPRGSLAIYDLEHQVSAGLFVRLVDNRWRMLWLIFKRASQKRTPRSRTTRCPSSWRTPRNWRNSSRI